MKIARNVSICLFVIALFTGCLTTGTLTPRSAYIEAEKQWIGLAEDYEMWKQADMVSLEDQRTIEGLFIKASDVLDLYKVAVLAGGDTGDYVTQLNNLKREILIELAKAKKGDS